MKSFIKIFIILCFLFSQGDYAFAANSVQGPTLGRISAHFGYRKDPFTGQRAFHKGLDIAAKKGTPIYALQDGVVVFSGRNGNYGKTIIIDNFFHMVPELPRIKTLYAHNSVNYVKKGEYVTRGQVIGRVGSTGRSTGPHLHFETIYNNRSINPIEYLKKLPGYLKYAESARKKRRYAKNYGQREGS